MQFLTRASRELMEFVFAGLFWLIVSAIWGYNIWVSLFFGSWMIFSIIDISKEFFDEHKDLKFWKGNN